MRRHSLLGQIVLSAGSGVLVFVALWTAAAILWLESGAILNLEKEADRQSQEISVALAPQVWNLDETSIRSFLETKVRNPEFVSIEIQDPEGGHIWSAQSTENAELQAPHTHRTAAIVHEGQEIGVMKLAMTLAPRQQEVADSILTLLLSLLLLFLAILASITLSWGRVSTRLKAMVQAMEVFSSSRTGEARMDEGRHDELGILARGFNTMAGRIQATTRSMELEIHERTEKLMESEKLALVGSLVAGVAHEINTPIGNGITVTSWLATRTKEIREVRSASTLTESALDEYLADVVATLQILQSGLDRTSNLIQSFKKIGADQVVDERRSLVMEVFLGEVVTSLKPTLKPFPHRVEVSCPAVFRVENHPGALFQIVTNLVLNAHHHAFGPEQAGTIVLASGPVNETDFFLSVRDNGAGMGTETLARIFQPFFTTKRMEGGTGLGLSIVHNLVQNLGGTIEVRSSPGTGSEFVVTLPREAPERVVSRPVS